MATDTDAKAAGLPKGFADLRCPLCNEDSSQVLDLSDLETVTCTGCSNNYTLDDVRQLLAAWQRVLDWVALAPPRE